MKVANLKNSSGNSVANQYVINAGDKIYFQSYNSMIAEVMHGVIYLDPVYYNYSKATSKYLYRFLNMNKKEIDEGLRSGKIKFKNLN
jgi:hypothetical protein